MKNEYDYLNDVKMDFTLYGEENISEEEIMNMKRVMTENKKKRPVKYIAIVCAAALVVTCTAFAGQGINKIIKTISTGHNIFYQVDPNVPNELPEELKGKIFDKEGKALNAISNEDMDNIYDAEGNKIDNKELVDMYKEAFGEYDFYDDYDPEEMEASYATIEEAQENAEFDIKVPTYIPEGFTLERAYQFKDGENKPSGLYANIVYKNDEGKEIIVHERLLNEETAFAAGGDSPIEETEIGGRKAVITGGDFISWETEDSVSVEIASKGNITKEELIKMAESVE